MLGRGRKGGQTLWGRGAADLLETGTGWLRRILEEKKVADAEEHAGMEPNELLWESG